MNRRGFIKSLTILVSMPAVIIAAFNKMTGRERAFDRKYEAQMIAQLNKTYGNNYVILNKHPQKPSLLWNGNAPHGMEKMECSWQAITNKKAIQMYRRGEV